MTERLSCLRHERSVLQCVALWLSREGLLLAISGALRLGTWLQRGQGLCEERGGCRTCRSGFFFLMGG